MKKIKFIQTIILILISITLSSQIAINNDGTDPHPSAMLDVKSTNSGILVPRLSTLERDNINSPAQGLMVYVIDDSLFYYHTGYNWMPVGGTPGNTAWVVDGNNAISNVAGNVGIGTTSPTYKLTIDGGHGLIKGNGGWNSSGDQARLYLGDGYHSLFAVHSNGLRIRSRNAPGFSTRWGGDNGVDFMTLQMATGYLGIGTTNPTAKLDVRGWNSDDGATMQCGNSDLSHKLVLFGGRENDPNPFVQWKDGDPLRFGTDLDGWSEKMRILSEGNVGVGIITTSDNDALFTKTKNGNMERALSHRLTISNPDEDDVLRLIGPYGDYGHGARLNFGDGNYVYIEEDLDDKMKINASRVSFPGSYVSIGTDDPEANLDVRGSIRFGHTGTPFFEIKKLTGNTSPTNTYVEIPYPAGWDQDNTHILCLEVQENFADYFIGPGNQSFPVYYTLSSTSIWIHYTNNFHNKPYRIVIMKI